MIAGNGRGAAGESYGTFYSLQGDELFFAFEAPRHLAFAEGLTNLFARYQERLQDQQLSRQTEIFLRFHLSDIANQALILKDYPCF